MKNFVFGIFLVFFVINWDLLWANLVEHISFKAFQFFFFPLINFPLTHQGSLFVSMFLSFFADEIYLFVIFLLFLRKFFFFLSSLFFLYLLFLKYLFFCSDIMLLYFFVLSRPDIGYIFIFYLTLNLKRKIFSNRN